MTTDKTQYQTGETIAVTVYLHHPNGRPVDKASGKVLATKDSHLVAEALLAPDPASPGLYNASLQGLPTGRITIAVEGTDVSSLLAEEKYADPVTTEVMVEPPLSVELRSTRCNLPLLRQIAAATNGMIVPPTAVPMLLKNLDLSPETREEVHQQALWPRWSVLAVLIAALSIEWTVRKFAGLA